MAQTGTIAARLSGSPISAYLTARKLRGIKATSVHNQVLPPSSSLSVSTRLTYGLPQNGQGMSAPSLFTSSVASGWDPGTREIDVFFILCLLSLKWIGVNSGSDPSRLIANGVDRKQVALFMTWLCALCIKISRSYCRNY